MSSASHHHDDPQLQLLTSTLAREIPMSQAMEFDVVSWEGERLTMRMPLEPNKNHQYSAFAGSLNALCTIVGWGTVFLLLNSEDLQGNIVIRRGKIRYRRPVTTNEIFAQGLPIDPHQREFFFKLMKSKQQSKIELATEIVDDQGPLVSFSGSYVVLDS